MAKRLTDTEKWNDDWYISLDNDYRIVWQWLLDNCNHAGICKRSIKLLNLMCNCNITEEELLEQMQGRVIVVDNNWFIPKFLKFQYTNLSSSRPVIVSVVTELIKGNYCKYIPESFGNDYKIIQKSLNDYLLIIKDKAKDMAKDKKGSLGENNGSVESGIRFDEDGQGVFFKDGAFQMFGKEQELMFKKKELSPNMVKRGLKY